MSYVKANQSVADRMFKYSKLDVKDVTDLNKYYEGKIKGIGF